MFIFYVQKRAKSGLRDRLRGEMGGRRSIVLYAAPTASSGRLSIDSGPMPAIPTDGGLSDVHDIGPQRFDSQAMLFGLCTVNDAFTGRASINHRFTRAESVKESLFVKEVLFFLHFTSAIPPVLPLNLDSISHAMP